MHSTKVRSGNNSVSVHVVGGDSFMTLDGRYDPNQLWFPFMDRSVFVCYEAKAPEPYKRANLPNYKYAQIDARYRVLYPTDGEADQRQMVLPFREGKRVSNKQAKFLQRYGFATWDKTPEGELYTIEIRSADDRKTIECWLKDNCQRRFIIKGFHTVTFESAIDAINGKMRFS